MNATLGTRIWPIAGLLGLPDNHPCMEEMSSSSQAKKIAAEKLQSHLDACGNRGFVTACLSHLNDAALAATFVVKNADVGHGSGDARESPTLTVEQVLAYEGTRMPGP